MDLGCGEELEARLIEAIRGAGPSLIALSGGVDSSVVARAAVEALGRGGCVAVTFSSPLHPPRELEAAREVARLIGVEHVVIELNELELPSVARNERDRCYACKRHRFEAAWRLARELGLASVIEGTNLDDLRTYRPGVRALRELGVKSPLIEVGLGRREVLVLARRWGLPVRASTACLATRFPYGRPLSLEALRRVAVAEEEVARLLGVEGHLRVRDHGDLARVEVDVEALGLVLKHREEVVGRLKALGYRFVALDLEGYRPGSFDQ